MQYNDEKEVGNNRDGFFSCFGVNYLLICGDSTAMRTLKNSEPCEIEILVIFASTQIVDISTTKKLLFFERRNIQFVSVMYWKINIENRL